MKLNLESHQLEPIRHLISKCKNQHGLIINHYMGTGKTLTALAFLKNFLNDKKTIIIPEGLENIWLKEIKNLEITNYKIITYKDLENSFPKYEEYIKNSVCIMDEAHIIQEVVKNFIYDNKNIIYNKKNGYDGKDDKWHQELLKKNVEIQRFLKTFYQTKKILLLTGTMVWNQDLKDLSWLINIAAGRTILPFDKDIFNEKVLKNSDIKQSLFNFLIPLIKNNPLNIIPKGKISRYERYLTDDEKGLGFLAQDIVKNKFLNTMNTYQPQNVLIPNVYFSRNNAKKYFEDILFKFILEKPLEIFFGETIRRYDSLYNFEKLDIEKLKKFGADKYISYYKYENNVNYPKMLKKTITVNYTLEQMTLLMRSILFPKVLKSQEYVDLNLVNDVVDAEFFKPDKIEYTDLTQIGNLYDNPEKFKEILKIYKSNNKSTIVYSNFHELGLLLFSKFLKNNNVSHEIYDLKSLKSKKNKMIKDFESGKNKMLLLHKNFYQGFSIKNCRVFHILEPLAIYEKNEQLLTRAVRYKSHNSLPVKERDVEIYQWVSTMYYDKNKLKQTKRYLELLKEENNSKTDLNIILKCVDFIDSPDDLLMLENNKLDNYNKEFEKTIKEISIKNTFDKTPDCAVWNDTFTGLKQCSL